MSAVHAVIFSDVNGSQGFGRYAGAYRIATALRQAGYTTVVIEYFGSLTPQELPELLDKFVSKETLIVGFATTLFATSSREAAKNWALSQSRADAERLYVPLFPHAEPYMSWIFDSIRQRGPAAKIIVGGQKVTRSPSYPGVDYWFYGESDHSIAALADHLRASHQPLKTHASASGALVVSEDYPIPSFHDMGIEWTETDLVFPGEHLPIELSRGCAFRCAFCHYPKRTSSAYLRHEESFRKEALKNFQNHGTTGYMFCDDTYNDSIQKVTSFHDLFTNLPFPIEFSAFARLDRIYKYPRMRELLLESGLKSVFFGIETMNGETAKAVGKSLDRGQVIETLQYLRETWGGKILMTGGFIVGLPGESELSISETLTWLQSEDCPLDAYSVNPFFLPPAKSGLHRSKISTTPEVYGYRRDSGDDGSYRSWENEHMTFTRACEIVSVFQKSEAYRRRNRILGGFVMYSRMRNLGYSMQDFFETVYLAGDWYEEYTRRWEAKRSSYFERMMRI